MLRKYLIQLPKMLKKLFLLKIPIWLLLGAITLIVCSTWVASFQKSADNKQEQQKDFSAITSIEKVQQTVFLDVGIQKIVTSKETTKVLFTDWDIPFSEKEAIIILNYKAKFGIKQSVQIDEKKGHRYEVTLPKFDVIGFELDKNHPYQLYDKSGGLLSYSTEDVDTGKIVADSLSNKEQKEYLKNYQNLVKDSAKAYYKQLMTSIDEKAKVSVKFQE